MPILDVQDVRAAAAFYAEQLGFETGTIMEGHSGEAVFAVMRFDNAELALNKAAAGATPGGTVQVMFYLSDGQDVDALFEQMEGRGVAIHTPIADGFWGDRLFRITDRDGYVIAFARRGPQLTDAAVAEQVRDVVE